MVPELHSAPTKPEKGTKGNPPPGKREQANTPRKPINEGTKPPKPTKPAKH